MIICQASQAQILKVMQIAASISDNKQLSLFANAKIEKTGKMLSVTSINHEMQITATSELGGDPGPFVAALHVRKVIGVLQSLPPNETVSLKSADGKLIFGSYNRCVVVNTLDAAGFPSIKFTSNNAVHFKMAQQDLMALIEQVAFAMPTADTREHLNGACLRISENKATMVATDTRKIAMATVDIQTGQQKAEVILPRKSVLELQRWFGSGNEMLEVQLTATQARFSTCGLEIITKLLVGQFPNFDDLRSKAPTTGVDVPRAVLLASLQRAIVISKENFTPVHIALYRGTLTLASEESEFGVSFDEISVNYTGTPIETSFDAKYLLDAVAHVKSEIVTLALGTNRAHLYMTKLGDDRFLYVAAQLRV